MISVSDILKLLDQVPVWKRLRGLPERVDEMEKRLERLEARMKPGAEGCPICGNGTLRVVSVRPDPTFGVMGVQQRAMECDACGHKETRQFDPRRN